MAVQLIAHMGDDLTIVNAARVSYGRASEELSEKDRGLIRFLMREQHASPFEHVAFTFRVETSIAVAREWMRHRTQSFNEFSTRYSKVGEAAFYLPDDEHVRTQTGKPGAYTFEPVDASLAAETRERMQEAYDAAQRAYQDLLDHGIAREVARNVLPLGMTTMFYATVNLRNVFNFLHLRTDEAALREIRDEAAHVEELVAPIVPVAYEAWVELGRNSL